MAIHPGRGEVSQFKGGGIGVDNSHEWIDLPDVAVIADGGLPKG